MPSWNNIIQTAQLGTEKRQLKPADLAPELQESVSITQSNPSIDREEQFLQSAALAFNFRQSGVLPATHAAAILTPAPQEDSAYCSPIAHQALKDILLYESTGLLSLWLKLCAEKQQIARPEVLPVLLNAAMHHKALRPAIDACLGHRGKWLARFNEDWQFTSGLTDDELWETGSPQQRKQALVRTGQSDPEKAVAWLKDTWPKENAATRTELLKDLPAAFFETNLPWLESLLQEKSQKVKEEALKLLKSIPSSSVVQLYWNTLRNCVSIVTEKTMLGLSSKKVLQIREPDAVDEQIFKTGIERSTNVDKNYLSADGMVMYQLAEYIPPHFWEAHLKEEPAVIFDLFGKDKTGEKLLSAMGMAAYRFGNEDWAPLFTKDDKRYFHDILPLLPHDLRERYMVKFFDIMPDGIIRFLTEHQQEAWGMDITRSFMKYVANNHYHYNRGFYNKFIHLLPLKIAGELDSFSPDDDYSKRGWTEMAGHILQLLSLKGQTIQAFQSINHS